MYVTETRNSLLLDNTQPVENGNNHIYKADPPSHGNDTRYFKNQTIKHVVKTKQRGRTKPFLWRRKDIRKSVGNFTEWGLCHYADHLKQDLHRTGSQILGRGGQERREEM